MPEQVFIYSLATLENPHGIRYIGKTKNIKNRLSRHISKYYLNKDDYKSRWLKKVLSENQHPIIEIIDIVNNDSWQFWEQYWICQFKAWGFKLTNISEGGDGVPITEDIIKRRSQKLVGRKRPTELVERIKISREKTALKNGYWHSENTKNKIANTLTGYKPSESTIALLSKVNIEKGNIKNIRNNIKTSWVEINKHKRKKVVQLNKENELINTFDSIKEASDKTRIDKKHIGKCCNNIKSHHTAGDYIWKFC